MWVERQTEGMKLFPEPTAYVPLSKAIKTHLWEGAVLGAMLLPDELGCSEFWIRPSMKGKHHE